MSLVAIAVAFSASCAVMDRYTLFSVLLSEMFLVSVHVLCYRQSDADGETR
jgi:hypothetical protein